MSYEQGDLVDVLIGNLWCQGVVDSVKSDGAYYVMLDTPPTIGECGISSVHADSTDSVGEKVLVRESSNNIVGGERIRPQE